VTALRLAAISSAFLTACLPAFDETGHACSAQHPCGPGFSCVLSQCVAGSNALADAGLVDEALPLANADFEQTVPGDAGVSAPKDWVSHVAFPASATVQSGLDGRNGSTCAVLEPGLGTATALRPVLSPATTALVGRTYCASVWARVTAGTQPSTPGLRMTVGGEEASEDDASPNGTWTRLMVSAVARTPEPLELELTCEAKVSLEPCSFDDTAVWLSASTTCTPPP
jgi:hypothetical protein